MIVFYSFAKLYRQNLLDKQKRSAKIKGMETFSLLDVTISIGQDGVVLITHRKTGLVTETTVKKLNSWAVAQLRKELITQPMIGKS